MKKNILNIIAVTALLFVCSGSLSAQTCTINGYVKDGPTGIPRAGTDITLQGFSIGTITNSSGFYSISNAPIGTITVASSLIGYSNSFKTIITSSGNTYRVDFWDDAVSDADGNKYSGVEIGTQLWMGENLKVGQFNDNRPINFAADVTQWINISNSTTSGYCWNGDNPANKDPYGALYNWYAVSTGKLCPIGWNVPSNAEWTTLTTFLGGGSVAGGKLKETGTAHWTYFISGGATNETGFTALPGGDRDRLGTSSSPGPYGSWWSTTEATDIPGDAYTLMLSYAGAYANLGRRDMKAGFSVRCIKSAAIAPTVTTTPASNISLNTAQSGGNITSDGGSSVTARGVCWSTSPNPTILNSLTSDGSGSGSFISSLSGLTPNTTYYVRAYATNDEGTGYADEVSFTTNPIALASLTTTVPTSITATVAVSGGNITSDGGDAVTARGVCWNITGNPTISDNHTTNGPGTGSFNSGLTELAPNTTYYIRAYATNSVGTAYGNQLSFTTLSLGPIIFNPGLTYGTVTDIDGNAYETIQIGSQVWMAENLKTTKYNDGPAIPLVTDNATWGALTTPAYCWYNNFINYKNTYGALYNWYAVNTGKLCPTNWHVPSDAEWTILTDYLGGASVAGGKLKEAGTAHWTSPNTGATNVSGFTALPGGFRDPDLSLMFTGVGVQGYWWSSTDLNTLASGRAMLWADIYVANIVSSKNSGYSVRCIQNIQPTLTTSSISSLTQTTAQSGGNITSDGGSPVTARGVCWSVFINPTTSDNHTTNALGTGSYISLLTDLTPNTLYYVRAYATNSEGTSYGDEISFTTYKSDAIIDADGNYYNIVTIGTQTWMAENLKTTKYNDGSDILNVTDNATWDALTTPAYAWYDNNIANKAIYGALYNWYAVETGRLCPVGWHVPTDAQLTQLTNFVGGGSVAGGKLKETGTTHWVSPNEGATDEYGFTALPGGDRLLNGVFYSIGAIGSWWSSTDILSNYAWHRFVWNYEISFSRIYDSKTNGISVRCVKDKADPTIVTNTNDLGEGSLRNALEYANSNPGKDTIVFNIQGEGPFSIMPLTPYPLITESVIIDGFTQPGASKATNNSPANLKIELDGINIPAENNWKQGLTLWAGSSTIRGLMINNFGDAGIHIEGHLETPEIPSCINNIIEGNFIGVDSYGQSKGNYAGGIRIWRSTGNIIGGDNPENRNIISGRPSNGGEGTFGILILLPESANNVVKGNYIGIGPDGETNLNGAEVGVRINESAHDNIIGPGNVISGNSLAGIQMEPLDDRNSYSNSIIGNYIGTNLDGTNAVPNGNGIRIFGAVNNKIGGSQPAERNIISGNTEYGIDINISGIFPSSGNVIQGNFIGLNADGNQAIPNGKDGVRINSSDNIIGGSASGEGNVIAFNSQSGISISGGAIDNSITGNSIHSNGGIGIDLGNNGVTLNDEDNLDIDDGPNHFQNYPVLESISFSPGVVNVSGHLKSEVSKVYILQFFASKVVDDTGYGEGQTYLGSKTVTTGTNGNIAFTETFPTKTIYGDVITATATDPEGNTSEFSSAVGGLQDQILANNKMPFHYRINRDGVPNISDGTDLTAVSKAFTTWSLISTANISVINDGSTTSQYASATDGVNLVSFKDDKFPFSPGVLAITAKTLKLGPTDKEAQIIDADIVFNPFYVKHKIYNLGIADNKKNAGYFDIQSVTTHEIGHILGLLHSGVYYSTMFFEIGSGIGVRSLEQDDKSWASYRYPKQPNYNNAFGAVSGNITYGYDGQPVVGALVSAINTATKDTVHAYSGANGNYLVPGLVPGSYNIYIEPLDGDVRGRPLRPGNISPYIYSNTVYTDYPGEFYSGSSESNTEDETNDLPSPVSVMAGTNTSGKNIITNQDLKHPSVVSVSPVNGSGSIKVLPEIIIKFSEPVDINTLSVSTCYLKLGDGSPLGGSYTSMGDKSDIILFAPEKALDYSTLYTLYITQGVTDLKGLSLQPEWNSSFTTVSKDNIPPTIISTIPSDKAVDIFLTNKIKIFFSEPMNKSSAESGITLTWIENGVVKKVDCSFSWDDYSLVTISPKSSLREGTEYTVTWSNSVTDLSNNALTIGYSTFKTVPTAAPFVTYIEPGTSLKTDVTIKTPVVVDFSEPINVTSVNSNTFQLRKGGANGSLAPGTFEFLNENSRVVFRPVSTLVANSTYTIILTNGIKDVSLPSMNFVAKTYSFITASKPSAPHIEFIDPPAGAIGAVVTISGTGFDPNPVNNKVFFSGIATNVEAVVKSASLTDLTVEVPVGAISGPYAVKVNGVSADNDPNSTFFYIVSQYLDPCNNLVSNTGTGSKSRDAALDYSGATAYITNPGDNTVSVITDLDKPTPKTLPSIQVGNTPVKIDINPQGTLAYVTNFYSHNVSVINLKSKTVTGTINVGINPFGIVASPNGKLVYVANYTSENISIIDVDPTSGGCDHVVANINTGTKNRDLDISPDAGMVVVTGDDGLKIIKLNQTDLGFDYVITNVSSGTKTRDVALTQDAGIAIVSTMEGNLFLVDVYPGSDSFGAVIANSSSGARAGDVKPEYSGLFVYVTNPDDNQVTEYKLTYGGTGGANTSYPELTLTEFATIKVGDNPEGLIIDPDNDRFVVVNSGTGTNGSISVISICCPPMKSPSDDIRDLIFTVQQMINNGDIPKLRGYALIVTLNASLRNIYAGRTKLAIVDLKAFIALVNTYIKNKQVSTTQGNALIAAANAIIAKLQGIKSDTIESSLINVGQSNLPDLISESKLGVIYPNPFSQSITINYEIAESKVSADKVLIRIYDISGRLVGTLVNKNMQSGRYSALWSGRYDRGGPAPFGTYFVRFKAGNVEEVREIMLVR